MNISAFRKMMYFAKVFYHKIYSNEIVLTDIFFNLDFCFIVRIFNSQFSRLFHCSVKFVQQRSRPKKLIVSECSGQKKFSEKIIWSSTQRTLIAAIFIMESIRLAEERKKEEREAELSENVRDSDFVRRTIR